jgi:hypothetical protein
MLGKSGGNWNEKVSDIRGLVARSTSSDSANLTGQRDYQARTGPTSTCTKSDFG